MHSENITDIERAAVSDELLRGRVTGALPVGFSGPVDADGAELLAVDMSGAVLNAADLRDVTMLEGTAARTRFEESRLIHVHVSDADLSGLAFTARSKLDQVTFERCKLSYANFFEVTLERVRFVDCAMRESRFHGVTMREVDVERCDLTGSSFDRLDVAPGGLDLRGSTIDDTNGLGLTRNLRVDHAQAQLIAAALLDANGIDVADDRPERD